MQNLSFHGNVPQIDYELKNGENDRYVPLLDIIKDTILSPKYKGLKGWVFNDNEQLLTKNQADTFFSQYLKTENLKFTQHMTRHAYATMLYNAGVDVKVAQRLLGHKCLSVTMEIYTHLDEQHCKAAARQFNNYIKKRVIKSKEFHLQL